MQIYCPVAVTPQSTLKLTELSPGKVVTAIPVPLNKLGTVPTGVATPSGKPTGQEAEPVVDTQVTLVQIRPALGLSLIMVPSAWKTPELLKVTV